MQSGLVNAEDLNGRGLAVLVGIASPLLSHDILMAKVQPLYKFGRNGQSDLPVGALGRLPIPAAGTVGFTNPKESGAHRRM